MLETFSEVSTRLTWPRHSSGGRAPSAVALIRVRLTAMKSAAGMPLPDTSAITKPSRPSSIRKKSKKSPPTSIAGVIAAWISNSRRSGKGGNSEGRIDFWIALATSSSLCRASSRSRSRAACTVRSKSRAFSMAVADCSARVLSSLRSPAA
jgi:hypothetical protein